MVGLIKLKRKTVGNPINNKLTDTTRDDVKRGNKI